MQSGVDSGSSYGGARMMALRCPRQDRLVLVSAGDLEAVANVELGLKVVQWKCCGSEAHWSAVGAVVSTDPERARDVVLAVRAQVLDQSRPSSMKTLLGSSV